MTIDFAGLFVQRSQALVEPGRALRKIGFHKRMHNLMYEGAAAGRDVHDERLVSTRVIAVRRSRFLAKERQRISLVGISILKQPDVENLFRIFRKEILLE